MKTKIHTVKRIEPHSDEFIGMNYYAAEKFDVPWKWGKNDIEVLEGLGKSTRRKVIEHEEVERNLMRRGRRYKTADREATSLEA